MLFSYFMTIISDQRLACLVPSHKCGKNPPLGLRFIGSLPSCTIYVYGSARFPVKWPAAFVIFWVSLLWGLILSRTNSPTPNFLSVKLLQGVFFWLGPTEERCLFWEILMLALGHLFPWIKPGNAFPCLWISNIFALILTTIIRVLILSSVHILFPVVCHPQLFFHAVAAECFLPWAHLSVWVQHVGVTSRELGCIWVAWGTPPLERVLIMRVREFWWFWLQIKLAQTPWEILFLVWLLCGGN